jgi:chromosome segregation ATPase
MMPTYVTREEFDARTRVLEGEVEGEKLVTRFILEQNQRNGADLATLIARVDHLASDVALVRGAVTSHTALLNVVVQDVGQLRQEMGGMRRDIGQLRQEMQRDISQLRQEIQRDVGELRQEMQQDRGQLRQEMGEMRRDMGMMHADIAAIRIAVAPHDPPGGG